MDYNITTFTLSSHHNPNNYVFNGKIMLCSVIILFVVVVILVCFHSYARWLFHHRQRRRRPPHHFFVSSTTNTNNNDITSTVPHQALDLSILKSIPTFIYSSTIQKQQLECAVCLSEFEDDEKGRVLPQCNHSFHFDCIEMWFHSHSTCPLCRTPVQANSSVQPPAISVEEVVSVTEPAGSIIAREEGETGCSSSSFPPLELVGVLVELPRVDCRGLDEMGLGSPEESGFKSPGNRVLALKRIWST